MASRTKKKAEKWRYPAHISSLNATNVKKELKNNPTTEEGDRNSYNRIINAALIFYFKNKGIVNEDTGEIPPEDKKKRWVYGCLIYPTTKELMDKELETNPETTGYHNGSLNSVYRTDRKNKHNKIINKAIEFYFKYKEDLGE